MGKILQCANASSLSSGINEDIVILLFVLKQRYVAAFLFQFTKAKINRIKKLSNKNICEDFSAVCFLFFYSFFVGFEKNSKVDFFILFDLSEMILILD